TRTNVFAPYRLTSGFEVVNVGREDTESDGANEDEDILELMTSGITCEIQELARKAKWKRDVSKEVMVGLAATEAAGGTMMLGTISCAPKLKEIIMLEAEKKKKEPDSRWAAIIITDIFLGLTVLHGPTDMPYPETE
ncbi:hypothetical protein B0A49_06464, partial [Cryomyces minteri]